MIRLESAHPTPGNPARLETLFTYDTCNQLVSTTDAMDRVTTNTYNPATCHLTGMTDPLGHTTTFANNALGQPTTIVDALGRQMLNTYDARGNLEQTQDTAGDTTLMGYDLLNRLIRMDTSDGAYVVQNYDAMGNATLVAAHGADEVGVVSSTSFAYDGRNRVIQAGGAITPTLSYSIAYAYDSVANPVQKTYSRNR